MTRPCPDHPRTVGASLGKCTQCDREAAQAREASRAHADQVRAALRSAPRPKAAPTPPPTLRDLAIERARDERRDQP